MNSSLQNPIPIKGTFHQRLFAYLNSQRTSFERSSAARKQALLGGLHGSVLELGPGSGPNLIYYAGDVRWVGVEPNPYMVSYLQRTILSLGRPFDHFRIDPGDPRGIRLPAADASQDAVVGTLVLCSVPHPQDSLHEILRVLKPGGKFVFIEHVAAPRGSGLRAFQNLLTPLWSWAGEGCHLNRETWETISQAGFARVDLEHYLYPGGGPLTPLIAGTAFKAD